MPLCSLTNFSQSNRRLIFLLVISHTLWAWAIFGLYLGTTMIEVAGLWWSALFIVLQLYAASQMILPVLLLQPEKRKRSFYLLWVIILALSVWMLNQISFSGHWQLLLSAIKSSLLLLVATVIGTVLARYVNRLWEIIPICIAMTVADLLSWHYGPTAAFTQEIEQYYLTPGSVAPPVDMILVKLALPGSIGLAPVFGISDWIIVVFFAVVAARYNINDNLIGLFGKSLAEQGRVGRYLPVSVAALCIAIMLAQLSGFFVPALPLIAMIMILWYTAHYLRLRWQA